MLTRKQRCCLSLLCLAVVAPVKADLIFTSPPRESRAKGIEVYQPITDYLSKVTGQKVVYQYPDNWLTYQRDMRKNVYDIVFDGPAFIGWREAKLHHVPLVKVPGKLAFVVIVKPDQTRVQQLKDLAGHMICAFPPPNLATLTVLYEFDNPVRQPLIVPIQSIAGAYQGVASGKCVAGILQTKVYEKLSAEHGPMKILFTSKPMSNQAFTAGPRISPDMQEKIARALLSEDGKAATQKLRAEFKAKNFEPATKEEYAGLGKLLRDVWGFEPDASP